MQVFMYVNQNKQAIQEFVAQNGKIEAIRALRTMFNIDGDFKTAVDLFTSNQTTSTKNESLGLLEAKILIESALYRNE